MTYLSFPGLGIEPFRISKTAFTVFGRPIAWYGIIICLGLILAVVYSLFRAKTEGIKSDDIIDLAFFLVIFGIIGARLYYVAFDFDQYLVTGRGVWGDIVGTLRNVVAVWEGGLAIYGGLIAGFLTIVLVCRHKKLSLLKMLDVVSPAVMIGQIIGRWGNFVNAEAHGTETALPWRMGILESNFENAELGIWTSEQYVHPTFLYESLWNLVGFIVANILYRKKKFDGQIFFFYMAWYGFGRMLIEGLRTDSLMAGPIRISQLVGFVTFVVGVALTITMFRMRRKSCAAALDGAVPELQEDSCGTDGESSDAASNEANSDEDTQKTDSDGNSSETMSCGEDAGLNTPAADLADDAEKVSAGTDNGETTDGKNN